jgi:hypothetical protein
MLLVFLGLALAGCDHDVHEARMPTRPNTALTVAHSMLAFIK